MPETEYNTLLELCNRRKSIRVFPEKPVPEEMLEKIKTIAETSPYASGKKNWAVRIVRDKKLIKAMGDSVREKSKMLSEMIRPDFLEGYNSYSRSFSLFENAPAIFVLEYRTPASFTMMIDGDASERDISKFRVWERDNYVKSISCAAMLVLLAAESLGLASCYMTGPLIAEDELKKIINIKPDRLIGAIIPVGFKKEDEK